MDHEIFGNDFSILYDIESIVQQTATNTMLINHNPICVTFTALEMVNTNFAEFSMKNTTAVNTASPTLDLELEKTSQSSVLDVPK
ncbi:hypothetical protein CEXT_347181 [Caerostris extrusa]|uniref:Uncharacterized protein n=1 Tax=Caerostris extrusa TaxID=172846 RepID=A0AAV4VEZ1_CAEEX|nr:hypothetical protein CEXT_347181 [Caerostris extrusa]